jgi:hypothetical protein
VYRPRTPSGWRLASFATALVGGAIALAAAVAGERVLAVQFGVRVLGVGLTGMGVATARVGTTAGEGAIGARLRAVALVGIGVALAVAPGAVARLAGP